MSGVVQYVAPNNTTQLGSPYKTALDNAAYVMARIGAAFAPHQSQSGSPSAPDMTVTVDAGSILVGASSVSVAQQVSAAFTAASVNPKLGLVYIDQTTGVIGIATGAEAASPSDPALPANKIPVARAHLSVGMAAITNADLDDLRPAWIAFAASNIPYDNSASGLSSSNVKAALDEVALNSQDQVARDMALAALIAATSTGGIRGPVVSFVADTDSFSTKTGATFSTDHYINSVTVAGGTGTALGNMTGNGGLAAAFDGTTSQATGACAEVAGAQGYIGKDWGLGQTKRIGSVTVYPSNDFGFDGAGNGAGSPNITLTLQGSTDNFSSSIVALGATTVGDANATARTITPTDFTAYRYHRISVASAGTGAMYVAEVVFSEIADMTLSAAAQTVGANAELVDVYVLELAVDVGPTRRVRASLDGGATWATGVLEESFTFADKQLYRYSCDTSAQTVGSPSNRSLKVEYNTLNDGKSRNFYRADAVPLYAS